MTNKPDPNPTTHFGYRQVSANEKTTLVGNVFQSVAAKYNIMNDVMSLGIHRLWKRFVISHSDVRAGHVVLDLAGGTGDLTKQFSRCVGEQGHVVLADINAAMLAVGRECLENSGDMNNVTIAQVDAQALPFAQNSFDIITIAFGLRNVTDIPKALASMYHVLKPGGRLLVLEFSKPILASINKLYDAYSFSLLPKLGKWIAKDEDSYRYLAESIRMHPDQATLRDMILNAGFDHCDYHNLTAGVVALHSAFKY